ncbi:polyribonucleotide nucleotidyltransferase [archaeon BMS3Bbin15]|nr:polyribonucleotide nucleotidyltransferase [archaeon BMS3Bbin15]
MVIKREPFPEENDLVVCTITKVYPYGAFARLDEYGGKDGYIHISEVASTWIKNIRDFVKEGQKTVAKVMGIDRRKGHIDLSLRRVSESAKKNKLQEWKRAQKAEKLLEMSANNLGKTLEDAYKEVGFTLEEHFGEIYGALEEISLLGEEALKDIEIPEDWARELIKIAGENVTIPTVEITGYVDLRCFETDGVEAIKDALIKAREGETNDEVKLDIIYVGSPRYRIKVVAPEYKIAEDVLRKAANKAIEVIKTHDGDGQFYREIKDEKN